MVRKEDHPASFWVSVTFQGRTVKNFGRVSPCFFFNRKCIDAIRVYVPASYVSLPECGIFFLGGGGGRGIF